MRTGSAQLREILRGSFDHGFTLDLYYDGARRMQNVPCKNVELREDGDAKIQQSGSLTIVWTDEFAQSISPTEVGSVLAPFGSIIHLSSIVSTKEGFSERVLLGQYEITDVPLMVDEDMLFQGQLVTISSTVRIEFKERLAGVEFDRFDVPFQPSSLASTYDELGRIAQLPITRTLPDAPISRSVVYEESRLDAVYDLSEQLGGIPHMTAHGTLSQRPKDWGAPVDDLRRGDRGSVVKIGRALSASGVYNRVAVRGKTDDQTAILATAQITDGALRVANPDGSRSPFGRRTRFLSSEYVVTNDQAQGWANSELPRSSSIRAAIVPVVEIYNPLRERGDVVTLHRARDEVLARVVTVDRSADARMDLTVEVLVGG